VAFTFETGANFGITTVASTPARLAASATPCAWFPALAVTTPASRSASESVCIRFIAPRILNAPVRWKFSSFRWRSAPLISENERDRSSGVWRATPETRSRASRMSARLSMPPRRRAAR